MTRKNCEHNPPAVKIAQWWPELRFLGWILPILFGSIGLVHGASATQATITITGTVLSGTDGNPSSKPSGAGNVFGNGSNLAGEPFTLTIRVSSSEGTYKSAACPDGTLASSSIGGSNVASAPTATLQIGSGSFTYGSYPLQFISWVTGRSAKESCSSYNDITLGWSETYNGTPYIGTSGFGSGTLYTATNFLSADLFTTIPPVSVLNPGSMHFAIGVTDPKTLKNIKYANGYLVPQSFSVSGRSATCTSPTVSLSAGVPQTQFMVASFAAPPSETVSEYARQCGFDYIDWQSKITHLPVPPGISAFVGAMPGPNNPAPLIASGNVAYNRGLVTSPTEHCGASWEIGCALIAPPTLYDPPNGGYIGMCATCYPFYYDPVDISPGRACLYPPDASSSTCTLFLDSPNDAILSFLDAPQRRYLSGEHPSSNPSGPYMTLETSLVGVSQTEGAITCGPGSLLYCTILFSWQWNSTFDGSNGGVAITNINGVALPPLVPSSQVAATTSGLAYSQVSSAFEGTITITNIGSRTIAGPLQVLLLGLPAGVTLMNGSNSLSGTPYLTIPTISFMSAQSVTVPVSFRNPSNATINFTPALYSGSL